MTIINYLTKAIKVFFINVTIFVISAVYKFSANRQRFELFIIAHCIFLFFIHIAKLHIITVMCKFISHYFCFFFVFLMYINFMKRSISRTQCDLPHVKRIYESQVLRTLTAHLSVDIYSSSYGTARLTYERKPIVRPSFRRLSYEK